MFVIKKSCYTGIIAEKSRSTKRLQCMKLKEDVIREREEEKLGV
jgi:hypothetical protein